MVEDNADNREILVFRLQQLGYEVLTASNGKEAVESAARSKPDLVLMDLRLPVMDGWQATRTLRQMDWGKSLPIIAVTAHAMDDDKDKALSAGCNDYIPKPILDYLIIQRKIEQFLK